MKFATVLLVAFACSVAFASEPGPQTPAFDDRVRAQDQIGAESTNVSTKVTLCHIPPGNPVNVRTIAVGQAEVEGHLAHGDSLGACHPACAGVPAAVPKTGQTRCWDNAGNPIACTGTGQDGDLQNGVSVEPRFADNGDGTVSDHLTGLIWLKNAGQNCIGLQTWADALSSSNTLASGSCGLTDGSVPGDWRLPNIRELQSLIDYGQINPAFPPGTPFTGVRSGNYWSSTTSQEGVYAAWFVNFTSGFVSIDVKTVGYNYNVWPVRGGQ